MDATIGGSDEKERKLDGRIYYYAERIKPLTAIDRAGLAFRRNPEAEITQPRFDLTLQVAQFLPLDRRLKGTPTAVAAGPTDRRCGMNRRRTRTTRRDYLIDTEGEPKENAKLLAAA